MQKPPGNNNSNGKRSPDQKGPPPIPNPLSEPIRQKRIVRSLDKTYELIEKIGKGGMGEVYKAANMGTHETVAIKVVLQTSLSRMDEGGQATAMARFKREAKLAVRVRHPNVVETTDFGFHEGNPFIVMEYFPGESLHAIMKRCVELDEHGRSKLDATGKEIMKLDETGRPLMRWEWLGPVMMQVCEGLYAAHIQEMMHRDIKPGNVMIEMEDGEGPRENWEVLRPVIRVKVLDFGLAKYTYQQGTDDELTHLGIIAGTPTYMSPEQIIDARNLDPRVDIYSVGAVIYRILTGQIPFPASEQENLLTRVNKMPVRPTLIRPEVPLAAENIILKAMAVKREKRYGDAIEMRNAIAESLGHGIQQPEEEPFTLAEIAPALPKRKRRWGKFIATVLTVAALGVGAYFAYEHRTRLKQKAVQLIEGEAEPEKPPPMDNVEKKGYRVKIDSNPSGLRVFRVKKERKRVKRRMRTVEQQIPLGKTPLSTKLEPGEHNIRVMRKWYRPINFKIDEKKPDCTVSFYNRRVKCK